MNAHEDHLRLIDAARARAHQLRKEAEAAYWDATVRAATRLAAALRRRGHRSPGMVEA